MKIGHILPFMKDNIRISTLLTEGKILNSGKPLVGKMWWLVKFKNHYFSLCEVKQKIHGNWYDVVQVERVSKADKALMMETTEVEHNINFGDAVIN